MACQSPAWCAPITACGACQRTMTPAQETREEEGGTPVTVSQVRARIKACVPGLRFKVRMVSFQDLARKSVLIVTSEDWTPETYRAAKDAVAGMPGVVCSD